MALPFDFNKSNVNPEALLKNGSLGEEFSLDDLYILPLDLYFLLPSNDVTSRLLLFGLISGFGVLTNLSAVVLMIRSRLVVKWTYAMLCNVAVSDLCVCCVLLCLFLPCTISNRWGDNLYSHFDMLACFDIYWCKTNVVMLN